MSDKPESMKSTYVQGLPGRRSFLAHSLTLVSGAFLLNEARVVILAATESKEKKMLTGELRRWRKLKGTRGLEAGLKFLERPDLATLPLGRHEIEGDNIFVQLQKSTTRTALDGKFESHEKYIDIQFLISGEEIIGLTPVAKLKVMAPYDEVKDIAFYGVPDQFQKVELEPGQFAVIFPGEGHMPLCAVHQPMEVHKAVVKVKLEYWKAHQK